MWARIMKVIHLTRGEKSLAVAFGAVVAMSAGITILVMSGLEGENAIPPEPTWYDNWVIFAGALSGGIALYLARGWMGMQGYVGFARAAVGSVAVALGAAVIAGTLILPLYGTIFGPIMVVTQFLDLPLLALSWFAVTMAAHALIGRWREERALGYGRGADRGAVTQLSRLSQINLYRNMSNR